MDRFKPKQVGGFRRHKCNCNFTWRVLIGNPMFRSLDVVANTASVWAVRGVCYPVELEQLAAIIVYSEYPTLRRKGQFRVSASFDVGRSRVFRCCHHYSPAPTGVITLRSVVNFSFGPERRGNDN